MKATNTRWMVRRSFFFQFFSPFSAVITVTPARGSVCSTGSHLHGEKTLASSNQEPGEDQPHLHPPEVSHQWKLGGGRLIQPVFCFFRHTRILEGRGVYFCLDTYHFISFSFVMAFPDKSANSLLTYFPNPS